MAEQEIAQHGKKVIKLLGGNEHGILGKLRELGIEIVAIVFAVSISIWFHGLSEHRHDQQQVHTFLIGLKHDIQRDLVELRSTEKFYREADANYAYLSSLDPHGSAEPGKFEAAYQLANANAFFSAERTRFDGFQTSGKLTLIENEELLNSVLVLYQKDALHIQYSEGFWGSGQEKLRSYLDEGTDQGGDFATRYKLLTAPKGKKLLKNLMTSQEHYKRYQAYIEQGSAIIKMIDKEYPSET